MFLSLAGGAETAPYTYDSFCDGIDDYNARHAEKAFQMGTREQQLAELAAFLGNAMHESADFSAARESLPCGDEAVGDDGTLYCKPCAAENYDWSAQSCGRSEVADGNTFGPYCSPSSGGTACSCSDALTEVDGMAGHVRANDLFIGRGVMQLSWNYNYDRASMALTGSASTFCNEPDLVASEGRYAFGTGIWFWMEHRKDTQGGSDALSTSHIQALKGGGDFGATLYNINGAQECPPPSEYYRGAAVMRVNRYCRAATVVGAEALLPFNGCEGLSDAFNMCGDDDCPDCAVWKNTAADDVEEASPPSPPPSPFPASLPPPPPSPFPAPSPPPGQEEGAEEETRFRVRSAARRRSRSSLTWLAAAPRTRSCPRRPRRR